jgi:DNA invertase Pin-like site-specific DNA recombinase
MNEKRHPKVKASHLAREAYLYVRQARGGPLGDAGGLHRQYALRQQAVTLGWPAERVIVIDQDVGCSGASVLGRRGFQQLLRRVGLGGAGLLMALEPSRWTRNARDWDRLVEACALSSTLLLDQHGIYDPADAYDRVLLGCGETVRSRVACSSETKEALV